MNIIVAVDENWGIGKDNNLLTHIPEDLKYFKEKTLDKVVIMGRKTFESLPNRKPLPDRINIVLTTNLDYKIDCIICNNKKELLDRINTYKDSDIFIIGGENVYKEFIGLCDTFFITKIYKSFDADKFFVNLDEMDDLEIVWSSEIHSYKGLDYQFFEYRRKGEE